MISTFYLITFLTSLLLTIIYLYKWHKHYEVNITIIFTLIPMSNLGYLLLWHSPNVESYITALKFIYMGGCFLLLFITLCVFRISGISVKRWVRTTGFLICLLMYSGVLTIGHYPFFYKNLFFQRNGSDLIIAKTYGPLHVVFYAVIGLYVTCGIFAILYSLYTKKQTSRRILYLLFLPEIIAILGYVGSHFFTKHMDLTPLAYNLAQMVYLLIIRRMSIYNVNDN